MLLLSKAGLTIYSVISQSSFAKALFPPLLTDIYDSFQFDQKTSAVTIVWTSDILIFIFT
jgi:hypothetical protein